MSDIKLGMFDTTVNMNTKSIPTLEQDFADAVADMLTKVAEHDVEAAKQLFTKRVTLALGVLGEVLPDAVIFKHNKSGGQCASALGLLNSLAAKDGKIIQALYDELGELIGFRAVSRK